jgi:hypothetical protein
MRQAHTLGGVRRLRLGAVFVATMLAAGLVSSGDDRLRWLIVMPLLAVTAGLVALMSP